MRKHQTISTGNPQQQRQVRRQQQPLPNDGVTEAAWPEFSGGDHEWISYTKMNTKHCENTRSTSAVTQVKTTSANSAILHARKQHAVASNGTAASSANGANFFGTVALPSQQPPAHIIPWFSL
jgi:hypothetical protein